MEKNETAKLIESVRASVKAELIRACVLNPTGHIDLIKELYTFIRLELVDIRSEHDF